MKTGVLFLLLLSLISTVYSFESFTPSYYIGFESDINKPNVKIYYGPNPYLDNENYVSISECYLILNDGAPEVI